MDIKTKYSIGERVYWLNRDTQTIAELIIVAVHTDVFPKYATTTYSVCTTYNENLQVQRREHELFSSKTEIFILLKKELEEIIENDGHRIGVDPLYKEIK